MTAQVVQIDTAAFASWHKRLDGARGEAIDGIFAFARECREFQQWCEANDRKQGGSAYTVSMAEWFGIKNPTSSWWAVVGAHAEKLVVATTKLPPSMETLYHLCELPDNVIAANVTEKTTQKEARALKAEHAPQAQKPHKESWSTVLLRHKAIADIDLRGGSHVATRNRVAKATGKPVPKYFTDKTVADQWAYEVIRALPREEAPNHNLSKSDQRKLDQVIAAETERLRGMFEKELYAEVDRRMPDIAAQREREMEENREETRRYALFNAGFKKKISSEEYRFLLQQLHPDRAPAGRETQYDKAFQIVMRLRDYAEA